MADPQPKTKASLKGKLLGTLASVAGEAFTKGTQPASASTSGSSTSGGGAAGSSQQSQSSPAKPKRTNTLRSLFGKDKNKGKAPAKDEAPEGSSKRSAADEELFNQIEAKIPTEDGFFEMMAKDAQIAEKCKRLVFWSLGPSEDLFNVKYSSRKEAEKWAKSGSVFWLRDMLDVKEYTDAMNKVTYLPDSTKLSTILWGRASAAFARHAQGVAYLILKEPCTNGIEFPVPEDYWVKYEWPVLIGKVAGNDKVTEIRRYEADDAHWNDEAKCYSKYAVIWTKEGGVVKKPTVVDSTTL